MERPDPASATGVNTENTEKKNKKKRPIGTIVALLALGLLAALTWYLTSNAGKPAAGQGGPPAGAGPTSATAPGAAPPAAARPGGGRGGRGGATTVGVARAERADIPVQLNALGTVTSPAAAAVRAQVSGVLQKIHYQEGQTVKAGQLLAQIDPRPFELALLQASGQRQRNEALLDNARVLQKRFTTLLEQDSIARQEVEAQTALVRQLEGALMSDRAAEGVARLNLGYTRITAPIAGRIGLRNVDVGNVTGPGDANGIAVITQMTPIDVVFAVPQDQLSALSLPLAKGEQLSVGAWDRTRARQLASGRFLALDSQIDAQTGTARAKARFNNADLALFPGQFVNVRLQLRTLPDSVLVPVAALRHGGAGDYVYVLNTEQRTVSLRPVKAGQMQDDKVQILSGLAAGTSVITEGADRLRDGAPVNLPGGARTGGRDQGGAGARSNTRAPGAGAGSGAAGETVAPAAGSPTAASPATPPSERRGHAQAQPQ